MKPKKEYIILVVLIVALSAYLALRREGSVHYKLPRLEKINKEEITKLTLKGASSDITLQKKNGKWLILPEKFPADPALLGRMERKISSLNLIALASSSGYDTVYGLDNSRAISVTAYHGNKVLRNFEVGKSASEGQQTFVKLKGDDRVFYADGNLRHSFDKKLEDLRDKTVLSFNDNITKLTIEKGKRKSVFTKAAPIASGKVGSSKKSTTPAWLTAAGSQADGKKINDIISTLSNLSCDSFAQSQAKRNFKKPTYVVTLKGKKSYSLSLFKKEGDNYPAISSQSASPFYMESWQAKELIKDLDGLTTSDRKVSPRKGKKV